MRLLQQVVELHPVGNLRERVVPGQVADAALGTLAVGDVARDEDVALELRIVRLDARARKRHRDRLSAPRTNDRLARLLSSLREIEALPLALIQHRDDAAPENLFLARSRAACTPLSWLPSLHHPATSRTPHPSCC